MMIGRTQQLEAALGATKFAGRPAPEFILVEGASGIGKSVFLTELGKAAAARGLKAFLGQCLSHQESPYFRPWVEALYGLNREGFPGLATPPLDGTVPTLAGLLRQMQGSDPARVSVPEASSSEARLHLFDGIAKLVRQVADAQPIAFLLDDAHLCEGGTLRLLEFLCEELEHSPILFVCAVETPSEQPVGSFLHLVSLLARDYNLTRIQLGPLSAQETGELVHSLVSGPVPVSFSEAVFKRTGGVSLHVEQLVTEYIGKSSTGPDELRARIAEAPIGIDELLTARFGNLSKQLRDVCRLLAVADPGVRPDVLAAALDLDEGELLAAIETLRNLRLVSPGLHGLGGFELSHPRVRNAVLSQLSKDEQDGILRRLARSFEEHGETTTPLVATRLAHYYSTVSAPTSAEVASAADYCARAAAAASQEVAWEDSIKLYESALAYGEKAGNIPWQQTVGLYRALGTLLRNLDRRIDAMRNFRRGMRLSLSNGDKMTAAELAEVQVWASGMDPDVAVATLDVGLQSHPDPESETVALLLAKKVISVGLMGRFEEAAACRREAERIVAKHNYPSAELRLALTRVMEKVFALDFHGLEELEQKLRSLGDNEGHFNPGQIPVWRLVWPLHVGQIEKVKERAAEFMVRGRRIQYRSLQSVADTDLAVVDYCLGDFRSMLARIEYSEQLWGGRSHMQRAPLEALLGDFSHAITDAQEEAAQQRRIKLESRALYADQVAGSAARRAGDVTLSDSTYAKVRKGLETRESFYSSPQQWAATHVEFSFEAALRKDLPMLEQCWVVLEPLTGLVALGAGYSPTTTAVDRALGVIAAAEGRWEDAEALFTRAEAFCETHGFLVEIALARLSHARALLDMHQSTQRALRPATAMSLTDMAIQTFERLGMAPYLAEAVALKATLDTSK